MEAWEKTWINKNIWNFNGHPSKKDFKTELHFQKYWEQQKVYHEEGFHGVNPLLYKFLTLYPISARADGTLSFPMFFNYDNEEIFPDMQLSLKHGTDQIVLKGRDVGFSSRYMGFLAPEVALTYPSSNICITSDNYVKTRNMVMRKISNTLEVMQEPYKPEYSYSEKYGIHFTLEGSNITNVDTNSRPTAFQKVEGEGYKYVVIDEAFIHEYADKLQQTLVFGQKKMGIKVGFTVMGGSATLNGKGLTAMQTMWESAKQLGIKPIFMPPQEYILNLPKYSKSGEQIEGQYEDCRDKYGRPDKKRVIEIIKRTRGILEKLNDKSILQGYILRYPIEVSEVFEFSSSAFWDKDEVRLIEEQRKVKESENRKNGLFKEKHFTLHIRPDNTILPIQGQTGSIVVIEPPKKGCEYIMSTDPIPVTSSIMKDRSNLASIIFKVKDEQGRADEMICSYYIDRKADARKMYDNMKAMQLWYNEAKNDLEKNNGFGTFQSIYKGDNSIKLLAKTPIKFVSKSSTKEEYGIPKHNDNKGELYDTMHSWVLNNIEKIYATPFFKEYKVFDMENTDFMDALVIGTYRLKVLREGKVRSNAANYVTISVWNGTKWMKVVKLKNKVK